MLRQAHRQQPNHDPGASQAVGAVGGCWMATEHRLADTASWAAGPPRPSADWAPAGQGWRSRRWAPPPEPRGVRLHPVRLARPAARAGRAELAPCSAPAPAQRRSQSHLGQGSSAVAGRVGAARDLQGSRSSGPATAQIPRARHARPSLPTRSNTMSTLSRPRLGPRDVQDSFTSWPRRSWRGWPTSPRQLASCHDRLWSTSTGRRGARTGRAWSTRGAANPARPDVRCLQHDAVLTQQPCD